MGTQVQVRRDQCHRRKRDQGHHRGDGRYSGRRPRLPEICAPHLPGHRTGEDEVNLATLRREVDGDQHVLPERDGRQAGSSTRHSG